MYAKFEIKKRLDKATKATHSSINPAHLSSCEEKILFYIPKWSTLHHFYRHDFVDVTLACADGSTLEAHKVILSSVSTYFGDILKVKNYSVMLEAASLFLEFLF